MWQVGLTIRLPRPFARAVKQLSGVRARPRDRAGRTRARMAAQVEAMSVQLEACDRAGDRKVER